MLKHKALPDPPAIDIVDYIEEISKWYEATDSSLTPISTEDLNKRIDEVGKELKSAAIDVLKTAESTESNNELPTDIIATMRIQQVLDVSKATAALYVALSGRDKTMKLQEK